LSRPHWHCSFHCSFRDTLNCRIHRRTVVTCCIISWLEESRSWAICLQTFIELQVNLMWNL
jgi:hypothetical protein